MEWLLITLTVFLHLLGGVLRLFYAVIYRKKPASIPPIKDPLLQLSATALSRMIRSGEISSQTIVEAYVQRIKEVNPFLNAMIEDRFEAAINEAKCCDEKLKTGKVTIAALERDLPLYGVPFTVKESCALKGLSYTGCTVSRQGMKAPEDGLAVERLRSAGGIPLCVTNTPELCCSFHSSNFLFGSTSNPYDTRKTSGGSSGGEGALIGAGASLFGVGSDIAGSIRVPAHFNGIFGHKPTPGIVPLEGHFPFKKNESFEKYLVLGPMARYADDLHLAVKIMTSKCGYDLHLDDPVEVKKLRVFHMDNLKSFNGIQSTSSEIRMKIRDATQYFAENGASVQQFPEDWLDDYFFIFMAGMFDEDMLPQILTGIEDCKAECGSLLECTKAIFGLSSHTTPAALMRVLMEHHGFIPLSKIPHYKKALDEIREKIYDLLKDDGIFIYPTYPRPALFPKVTCLMLDYSVYASLSNLLQLPSTHVPMGLNKDGLPIGVQVIAGPRQDRLCLAAARKLEKHFGGWIPPAS